MHDPSPEALRRLLDDVARLATDYAGGIDARPIQPATTAAELERRLAEQPYNHQSAGRGLGSGRRDAPHLGHSQRALHAE